MIRQTAPLIALIAALAAMPAVAQGGPEAATLERDVRVLADDSMQGREAGTVGHAMAAAYVAGRLAALGLKPGAANGTFFQAVPMRRIVPARGGEGNTLAIQGVPGLENLTRWTDYVAAGRARQATGSVEAPLVFVGYALSSERLGRDDLAGIDLRGKIAVFMFGAPANLNTEERAHFRSTMAQRLSDRGAVGAIVLDTPGYSQLAPFKQRVEQLKSDASMAWVDGEGQTFTTSPNVLGIAYLSADASRKLMAGRRVDYDDVVAAEASPEGRIAAFDMGVTARIDFASEFTDTVSNNVVGVLPGTDPDVADEHVVLTGHLDHEGVKPSAEAGDDEIYNGAMDNAVGIASMLEVARLLAASPPRRPVMFVALTAEEKGLVGSSYNANNLTVPAGHVVANLNLDMPIVTYPFTDVNAFGVERTNMLPVVTAAVERAGLTLSPDPDPAQGLFVRSDQYSYVKAGIPAIYMKTGFADGGKEAQEAFRRDHYHKASDEVGLVDFTQLARFTAVNHEIARGIADMAERPLWNRGDFFATEFNGPQGN